GGSGGMRLRKGLVVAQVAISMLLLMGAGLFIRSLRNLRLIDLGIRTENLIAFNVVPTYSGYTSVSTKQFDQRLQAQIAALLGVSSAAFAQIGLFEGSQWDSSLSVEGYDAKPGEDMSAYCNAVSPGYFKTLGIPMVEGRDFTDRDARFVPSDPNAPSPGYQVA